MKLYDVAGNSSTRRIRALAKEVDVRLEQVTIDLRAGEGQKPDYLKLNPNGKIPTLVDGDFNLFETNAILCYLAAKMDRKDLLPTEPKARAQVDQWLHWQNAHLSQAMGKVAVERFYKPKFGTGPLDAAHLEMGLKEVERFCTVLNGWLATRDYVCGTVTVADFSLAGTFALRDQIQIDVSQYPHVAKWLERVESRPSWQHAES